MYESNERKARSPGPFIVFTHKIFSKGRGRGRGGIGRGSISREKKGAQTIISCTPNLYFSSGSTTPPSKEVMKMLVNNDNNGKKDTGDKDTIAGRSGVYIKKAEIETLDPERLLPPAFSLLLWNPPPVLPRFCLTLIAAPDSPYQHKKLHFRITLKSIDAYSRQREVPLTGCSLAGPTCRVGFQHISVDDHKVGERPKDCKKDGFPFRVCLFGGGVGSTCHKEAIYVINADDYFQKTFQLPRIYLLTPRIQLHDSHFYRRNYQRKSKDCACFARRKSQYKILSKGQRDERPPAELAMASSSLEEGSEEEPDKCCICLQQVTGRACVGTCLHSFCWDCIDHWTSIQLDQQIRGRNAPLMLEDSVKLKCPLCKSDYRTILKDIRSDSEYKIHNVTPEIRRRIAAFQQQQQHSHRRQSSYNENRRRRRTEYEWGVGAVRRGDDYEGQREGGVGAGGSFYDSDTRSSSSSSSSHRPPSSQFSALPYTLKVGGHQLSADANLRERQRFYDALKGISSNQVSGLPHSPPPFSLPLPNISALVPWLRVEIQAAVGGGAGIADPVLEEYVVTVFETPPSSQDRRSAASVASSSRALTRHLRPFFHSELVVRGFLTRIRIKQQLCSSLFRAAQQWRRRGLGGGPGRRQGGGQDAVGSDDDDDMFSRNSHRSDRTTRRRDIPLHVVISGRYGSHSGMNGLYACAGMHAGRPVYIQNGRGEAMGGEIWRWILRFYPAKSHWKIDYFPTPRDADNCFGFIVSNAYNPADTNDPGRGWSVWETEEGEWAIDRRIWISRVNGRRRNSASATISCRQQRRLFELKRQLHERRLRTEGGEEDAKRRSRYSTSSSNRRRSTSHRELKRAETDRNRGRSSAERHCTMRRKRRGRGERENRAEEEDAIDDEKRGEGKKRGGGGRESLRQGRASLKNSKSRRLRGKEEAIRIGVATGKRRRIRAQAQEKPRRQRNHSPQSAERMAKSSTSCRNSNSSSSSSSSSSSNIGISSKVADSTRRLLSIAVVDQTKGGDNAGMVNHTTEAANRHDAAYEDQLRQVELEIARTRALLKAREIRARKAAMAAQKAGKSGISS
eukprot:jgi/Bigna1/75682/fgenesh1_pg.36_\